MKTRFGKKNETRLAPSEGTAVTGNDDQSQRRWNDDREGAVQGAAKDILGTGAQRYSKLVETIHRRCPNVEKSLIRSVLREMKREREIGNAGGKWFLRDPTLPEPGQSVVIMDDGTLSNFKE